MNKRTAVKIEALTVLMNHPKTSAEEADAARRALARICITQNEQDKDTEDYQRFYNAGHWRGSKYEESRRLGLAEIAKLMRQDIKIARKVGKVAPGTTDLAVLDPIADAPAQIKISIRSGYFSGGGAIDVTISNVPAEWGWTEQEVDDGYGNQMRKVATPAMAAFKEAIEQIHRAYNYDNSDTQADYFERHYWGHVEVAERIHFLQSWEYAA